MLFKTGHIAKQPTAVFEERHAPFDRFSRRRAGLVDELAQMLEDGPGKPGTFRNIGVDAWIGVSHDENVIFWSPSFLSGNLAILHQMQKPSRNRYSLCRYGYDARAPARRRPG